MIATASDGTCNGDSNMGLYRTNLHNILNKELYILFFIL